MKYYLDTNFILYLLGSNLKTKEKCLNFLKEHEGEYYISTLVILEGIYVLQKVGQKGDINKFIDFVKEFKILNFSFKDIVEALKIEKLKIFDALHYVISRKINATLVTFDKDFENLEDVILLS